MSRLLALASMALVALSVSAVSRVARAQSAAQPQADPGEAAPSPPAPAPLAGGGAPPNGNGAEPPVRSIIDPRSAPPPPTNVVYLQYGVAFTAEVVSAAGPICDNVGVPCILGPGAGVAVRAGLRGTGAIYLGGAYELSKQDPGKLLRLAILQQARAEGRYYFATGRDTEPYLSAGMGIAGYGNEWGVDTWGPAGFVGAGVEAQLTRRTVVGVAINYRLLYLQQFTDSSGADRSAGIAQLVGLDLVLEQRDPIFRASSGSR